MIVAKDNKSITKSYPDRDFKDNKTKMGMELEIDFGIRYKHKLIPNKIENIFKFFANFVPFNMLGGAGFEPATCSSNSNLYYTKPCGGSQAVLFKYANFP